jgi:hypothetical protein
MARTTVLAVMLIFLTCAMLAQTSTKTLASSLNIYAFPQQGQSSSQQSQAESDCYTWAVQNTGNDPFQLQKQASQQAQQTAQMTQQAAAQGGQGTTAATTVKGAALGTLIGGISGNEGKGAAYGAAAGFIRGRRVQKSQSAAAAGQAQAQGQQMQAATEQDIDNFKKAFSVCLEGKGYMVKY